MKKIFILSLSVLLFACKKEKIETNQVNSNTLENYINGTWTLDSAITIDKVYDDSSGTWEIYLNDTSSSGIISAPADFNLNKHEIYAHYDTDIDTSQLLLIEDLLIIIEDDEALFEKIKNFKKVSDLQGVNMNSANAYIITKTDENHMIMHLCIDNVYEGYQEFKKSGYTKYVLETEEGINYKGWVTHQMLLHRN